MDGSDAEEGGAGDEEEGVEGCECDGAVEGGGGGGEEVGREEGGFEKTVLFAGAIIGLMKIE